MAACQLVGLVGRDEGDPARPTEPGQERRERPRARVGTVEILEDHQRRPALTRPGHDPGERLEKAGLAALRVRRRASRREQTERGKPGTEIGQELLRLTRGRADHAAERIVVERGEMRQQPVHDRAVRPATVRAAHAAVEDRERVGQAAEPTFRLDEEPADPGPRAGTDENRDRPAGYGRAEGGGEARELAVAAHEPLAREPGHRRILRPPGWCAGARSGAP